MNTKLVLPIARAGIDIIYNMTVGKVRTAAKDKTKKSISVIQAHPDDEILIAGILQRLFRTNYPITIITTTNGDGNTDVDRVEEYQRSLIHLGHPGINLDDICLCSEREILDLITTPRTQEETKVSDKNISKCADLLIQKIIDPLKYIFENKQVQFVFTDDYAGGHVIHDLTQICVSLAVRHVNRKTGRKIEIYEFPQYWLKGTAKSGMTREEITEYLKISNSNQYSPKEQKRAMRELRWSGLTYELNSFFPRAGYIGFLDPKLGMFGGAVDLSYEELFKKVRCKHFHSSQKNSLGRLMNFAKIRKIATERIRQVPENRDYSKKPYEPHTPTKNNIPLYEIIPWRPVTLFDTVRRVYKKLVIKQLN